MNLVERERAYIRKWRKIAQSGDRVAMMNVAAAYRLLGNTRQQFRWYDRAAELCDAEAMYFLAVLLLQTRPDAGRREILSLLRRANVDSDYPQAADLSGAVRRNEDKTVCVCRRDLMRRIATRSCSLHRKGAD